MPEIRPDLQPTYDLLCSHGLQFPEPYAVVQLEGLTYAHPKKGNFPVMIDPVVLAAQGRMYSGDPDLRAALRDYDIVTEPGEAATNLLEHHLGMNALTWGVSGYASGGINPATGEFLEYQSEAEGLSDLYDYLAAEGKMPSLVIDGGVSEGFLALNSVIAQSAGVPTLGFIPREGLASVGVRDHMVIAGETYPDREPLVGTADVLVCAGGEGGTIRECLKAARYGATVLILKLKDYPPKALPNVYHMHEDLRKAADKGRLVVCKSREAIPESVDRLLRADVKSSRPARIEAIADFLS